MSCCACGASSTGAVVEKSVVLPQLQLLRNSLRAAHELRWGFLGPCTQVQGWEAVSTGTRPPYFGASTGEESVITDAKSLYDALEE